MRSDVIRDLEDELFVNTTVRRISSLCKDLLSVLILHWSTGVLVWISASKIVWSAVGIYNISAVTLHGQLYSPTMFGQ